MRDKIKLKTAKAQLPRLTFFQRLSLFFFDRPRATLLLWLIVFLFGTLSYSTFLKREGFPSVQIPFTSVSGSYLVNDPEKVDLQIAKPIGDIALKQPGAKAVQSSSASNFFTLFVQYETGTDSDKATKNLKKAVDASGVVPTQADIKFEKPRFGITERGDDIVISFFGKNTEKTIAELADAGKNAAAFLKQKNISQIQKISIIDPFVEGVDPSTGRQIKRQTSFDRYLERQNNRLKDHSSVVIGAQLRQGADVLEADKAVRAALDKLNSSPEFSEYRAVISATFADDIDSQIQELQKALLEGLLAVLVVGSIVIAVRASIITVLSMITVIAVTLGALFFIGYSLNTITLFALILGLALIVDDTIIMVEAVDAQRRRLKSSGDAVKTATRKVGRAMIAATSTAALSFAPLLFVGGVLGGFIRAIPVTIIISLITSLAVALIFIPRFARTLMLGKNQMGRQGDREIAAGLEAATARAIARPMLWAKGSTKRLLLSGISAVLIGLTFIGAGSWLFSKVTFNIFPPSKDSNAVILNMNFPSAVSLQTAETAAKKADTLIANELGSNMVQGSYYGSGDQRNAMLFVDLSPYDEREVRAPQIVDRLEKLFANFQDVQVQVQQADVGPPAAVFGVRIKTDDRDKAYHLAGEINRFLNGRELTRLSGQKAKIVRTSISNPSSIDRVDGERYIEVSAEFNADDTSTLVTLAQNAVKKEFSKDKLAKYGFSDGVLDFNLGGEEENQESFKTLIIAFPILLAVIYLLLAFQFRSLLQPALIFLAIPFSLFGITLGLYLTDNAFSFFAMLGFFALIGLSIKNTILLTDYANQARAAGKGAVDSVVDAIEERFRPLIATSLTAVVSLIPLGILSPFWEGLVVVLIFGLLSSTFLVITVFPYYYLGAELLRRKVSRKNLTLRAAASVLAIGGGIAIGAGGLGFALAVLLNIGLSLYFFFLPKPKNI